MSTLTTLITARIKAELLGSADQGTVKANLMLDNTEALISGTGSGAADRVFSDQRTLSASATETLDLTSLTDVFGAALSFAKIKAILVVAATGNTNNVIVGAAASNIFFGPFGANTHTAPVRPGGTFLVFDVTGWTVSGSLKNLKIANSAGTTSVTYDIMIIGTSA